MGKQEQNIPAIIGLVTGVMSVTVGCFCYTGIPLGLAAVICGVFGIMQSKKSGKGFEMALGGLICGGLALLLNIGVILFLVVAAIADANQ